MYSFLWLQLPEHRVRAVSEHLLVVNLMMKNLTFASILQKLNSSSSGLQPKDAPTRRERDVLEAVAKGMNTHEIAALLKISENTVETFRKRLISKFGAKNAIDMVVKAVSQGWIKLD